MAIKINIPKHAIEAKIQNAWNDALPLLTEEIKNDCNEYCKWDNGDLNRSADIHSLPKEGKIIWQTPYARRQYWEIQTANQDGGHPKATWKWAEVAKQHHKKQWEKQAQKIFESKMK